MIRTNLYLPKTLHQALKRFAREKNSSMAELTRKYLEERVEEEKKSKNGVEVLLKMAARAKKSKGSGLGDLAANHDYYLYGKGRR